MSDANDHLGSRLRSVLREIDAELETDGVPHGSRDVGRGTVTVAPSSAGTTAATASSPRTALPVATSSHTSSSSSPFIASSGGGGGRGLGAAVGSGGAGVPAAAESISMASSRSPSVASHVASAVSGSLPPRGPPTSAVPLSAGTTAPAYGSPSSLRLNGAAGSGTSSSSSSLPPTSSSQQHLVFDVLMNRLRAATQAALAGSDASGAPPPRSATLPPPNAGSGNYSATSFTNSSIHSESDAASGPEPSDGPHPVPYASTGLGSRSSFSGLGGAGYGGATRTGSVPRATTTGAHSRSGSAVSSPFPPASPVVTAPVSGMDARTLYQEAYNEVLQLRKALTTATDTVQSTQAQLRQEKQDRAAWEAERAAMRQLLEESRMAIEKVSTEKQRSSHEYESFRQRFQDETRAKDVEIDRANREVLNHERVVKQHKEMLAARDADLKRAQDLAKEQAHLVAQLVHYVRQLEDERVTLWRPFLNVVFPSVEAEVGRLKATLSRAPMVPPRVRSAIDAVSSGSGGGGSGNMMVTTTTGVAAGYDPSERRRTDDDNVSPPVPTRASPPPPPPPPADRVTLVTGHHHHALRKAQRSPPNGTAFAVTFDTAATAPPPPPAPSAFDTHHHHHHRSSRRRGTAGDASPTSPGGRSLNRTRSGRFSDSHNPTLAESTTDSDDEWMEREVAEMVTGLRQHA